MKITRYLDQSICINHQFLVTVHEMTMTRAVVHCMYVNSGEASLETLGLDDGITVCEYGTRLKLCDLSLDPVGNKQATFEIEVDPNIIIHRLEENYMH